MKYINRTESWTKENAMNKTKRNNPDRTRTITDPEHQYEVSVFCPNCKHKNNVVRVKGLVYRASSSDCCEKCECPLW